MTTLYKAYCFGMMLFFVAGSHAQTIPDPVTYAATYGYDDLGRLTAVDIESQLSTVYTYDAIGNMTSLSQTAFSGVFVEPEQNELPSKFALHPAYPNPFNPQTTIQFDLPRVTSIQLELFDALGRMIRVLENGITQAGSHEVVLSGRTLSTGVYFVVMSTPNQRMVQKLLLLK